jgi:hypothetical protein
VQKLAESQQTPNFLSLLAKIEDLVAPSKERAIKEQKERAVQMAAMQQNMNKIGPNPEEIPLDGEPTNPEEISMK